MNLRLWVLCSAVLLFGVTFVYAQDSAEKDVQKAMDENFAAIMRKDAAALNSQYTDDYYRIGETGKVTGKSQTIASFLDPNYEITKLEATDVKIRVYGDLAVVTETVTSLSGPKGKANTEHAARQTVVWLKRNGVWQKNVFQTTSTTPIPESAYTH